MNIAAGFCCSLVAMATLGANPAMAQEYTISGSIIDAKSGSPIENASRVCFQRFSDRSGAGCTSPDAGRYTSPALSADDYLAWVEAPGYVSQYWNGYALDACGNSDKGDPITVGPNDAVVDFHLVGAFTVKGKVLTAGGAPTRLATILPRALNHNHYCGAERTFLDGGGNFDLKAGGGPLTPGDYVVSAIPIGPGAPAHQLVSGGPGDVIDNLVLQLGGNTEPRVSDTAPLLSLISISEPDANYMVTLTGADGAAAPKAKLYVINIDIGSSAVVDSDENGAFTAALYAPAGSMIVIKQDPDLASFWGLTRGGGDPFAIQFPEKTLGGVIISDQRGASALDFRQAGQVKQNAQLPLPAWQITGQISTNVLNAGDGLQISGQVRVLTDNPAANARLNPARFYLERITDEDGYQVIPESRFTTTFITPTGLPIERIAHHEDFAPGSFRTNIFFTQEPGGEWVGPFDFTLNLPEWLPPGYYQPRFKAQNTGVNTNEPPNSEWFLPFIHTRPVQLPVIKVGDPQPPKMFLHLLTNRFHNGSRGIRAVEDFNRFGLTPVIATPSDVLVIPMRDPQSGNPVQYSLDPFISQITRSERSPPYRRMPWLELPSGQLTVEVEEPSGALTKLGPSEFRQLTLSSPSKADGGLVSQGGQHQNNVVQLRTMDPQFDVHFSEYGKHIIRMEMNVDDVWGNNWTGSGTFEVHVARPLVLDTTVFPGAVFQEGDTLHTGVVISPPFPADVEFSYSIAPNSDAGKLVKTVVSGTANHFGHFQNGPGGILMDQAGEYRADVVASYTDDQGVLWMGSRTWGGVVARPNPPIAAHGRRAIDDYWTIGPQWFTRVDLGVPEGNSHIPFPFSNGDIQWVHSGDAAIPRVTFQDLTGSVFGDLVRNRLSNFETAGPGSINDRIGAGEMPLQSGMVGRIDPHLDPDSVDMWAYGYTTTQRPLVRVREMIAEDSIKSYWRFDEKYSYQVGVGLDGDKVNDIKFQYGGAVVKGNALAQAEYAIYGSLFVLVSPPGEPGGGSRTFPPFQGNGGGPSGGPIIVHKGEDIDIFINLRAVRPGSILEIGDTFSIAGAIGPTLPAKVSYTVNKPDGSKVLHDGQANPVGYYYDPADDFSVDQAGIWSVDIKVIFDGATSAGQVTEPFPTGSVIGSVSGSFFFYVQDENNWTLPVKLPRESLFETVDSNAFYRKKLTSILPQGLTVDEAHVTTMMPGTILESRNLDVSKPVSYFLEMESFAWEVPNLDVFNGLADLVTISLFVKALDGNGEAHHFGKVIHLQGARIFNPPGRTLEMFSSGFEGSLPTLNDCKLMNATWTPNARDCAIEDCSGDEGRLMSWDGKMWCRVMQVEEGLGWFLTMPDGATTLDFWADWGAWDRNDCGDGKARITVEPCGLEIQLDRSGEEQHHTCHVEGWSWVRIKQDAGLCDYVIIGDPYFY